MKELSEMMQDEDDEMNLEESQEVLPEPTAQENLTLEEAKEGLPEEAQKLLEEIQQHQKDVEEFKKLSRRLAREMFHSPTPPHSNKNRGVGVTRKNREETKSAKKLAKRRRLVNRKISSKKSRPTGSKKRK